MQYTFFGQFQGELAPDFREALSAITVRIYRYRGTKYITSLSVQDPTESMVVLSPDAVSGKASALVGETTTDADGNFVFVLDPESGYAGEALELDLLIPDVPGHIDAQPHGAVQLALTTLKPRWISEENGLIATWSYTIPDDFWTDLRAKFDAWVVCGRVMAGVGAESTVTPLANAEVMAYDADWLQDDYLGSATTDADGHFRIDFAHADFLKTPLSPLINYEQGGPDLYFVVKGADGKLLLQEPKALSRNAGRADCEHSTYVELVVELADDAVDDGPMMEMVA